MYKTEVIGRILIFAIFLFCGPVSYAEQISGLYDFNANGYTGILNIELNGRDLSGYIIYEYNPVTSESMNHRLTLTNTLVQYGQDWYGRPVIKIIFSPGNENQIFHGWFSWDRRLVSGYFENQYIFPWSAER